MSSRLQVRKILSTRPSPAHLQRRNHPRRSAAASPARHLLAGLGRARRRHRRLRAAQLAGRVPHRSALPPRSSTSARPPSRVVPALGPADDRCFTGHVRTRLLPQLTSPPPARAASPDRQRQGPLHAPSTSSARRRRSLAALLRLALSTGRAQDFSASVVAPSRAWPRRLDRLRPWMIALRPLAHGPPSRAAESSAARRHRHHANSSPSSAITLALWAVQGIYAAPSTPPANQRRPDSPATLITVLSIPMYWGLFHARGSPASPSHPTLESSSRPPRCPSCSIASAWSRSPTWSSANWAAARPRSSPTPQPPPPPTSSRPSHPPEGPPHHRPRQHRLDRRAALTLLATRLNRPRQILRRK